MKFFIEKSNCCGLNYQHNYIHKRLLEHMTRTKEAEEADVIIIAETCACIEFNILNTFKYYSWFSNRNIRGCEEDFRGVGTVESICC